MRTLRRFLLLTALLIWQGGLLAYAALVVPVSRRILHDHLDLQALITSEVTNYLNYAGFVALLLWLWEWLGTTDDSGRRVRWRWLGWAVLLMTLATLEGLHLWMDSQLKELPTGRSDSFYLMHRLYLWVGMAQSVTALALLWATLRAWRAEDSTVAASSLPPTEIPSSVCR